MADLDHIHTAIANLYPGAGFSAYIWGQPNGEDGKPEGEPAMLLWDEVRFGPFDLPKVLAECRRLAGSLPPAPDNPTLRDWRVALLLWGRLEEVSGKVKALVDKGDPMGAVARESLEYANNVLRAQLLQLRGVFGFTEAEVEESLWRAERVRLGDLSGTWPLPAEKKTT